MTIAIKVCAHLIVLALVYVMYLTYVISALGWGSIV